MNYWFWLFIVTSPLLVFIAKPETPVRWRILRLFGGVLACYVFANLALHFAHARDWQLFQACQSQFPDGAIQRHPECHIANSGADTVFYLYFGWIIAAVYIGLWEALWRIIYRKRIRAIGAAFKGKWASNTVITFAFLLLVAYPTFGLFYWGYVSFVRH